MRRINYRKGREQQNRTSSPSSTSRGLSALREAETLQQRAERKKGLEAVPVCISAVEAYRQALGCTPPDSLSHEQQASARLGLAAALQYAAQEGVSGSRGAEDEDVRGLEASAQATARQLLQEAVLEYRQAVESGERDALVDCGNALSELAGVGDQANDALRLLGEATEAYKAGLAQEEDALTYSNLGDCLVASAELMCDSGRTEEGRQQYLRGMEAYSAACGMSSSEAGDDLPGLLYNWGVGLHSAGTHLNDPAALNEAVEKLKAAKGFERGDTLVMNALGDALVALSECTPDPDTQRGLLQSALSDGYSAALRIDRRNSDALVGTAEVEMQLGRGSSGQERLAHFQQSSQAYSTALQNPRKLGGFKDRCDVRYNFACASCLAGQPQAAEATLQLLLSLGSLTIENILKDGDLEAVHNSSWLQQLQSAANA